MLKNSVYIENYNKNQSVKDYKFINLVNYYKNQNIQYLHFFK